MVIFWVIFNIPFVFCDAIFESNLFPQLIIFNGKKRDLFKLQNNDIEHNGSQFDNMSFMHNLAKSYFQSRFLYIALVASFQFVTE